MLQHLLRNMQMVLSVNINGLLKLHWQCRYDEFDVADRLRQRGWVVPAYTMAPGAEVSAESPCSSVRLYSALNLAVSGLQTTRHMHCTDCFRRTQHISFMLHNSIQRHWKPDTQYLSFHRLPVCRASVCCMCYAAKSSPWRLQGRL